MQRNAANVGRAIRATARVWICLALFAGPLYAQVVANRPLGIGQPLADWNAFLQTPAQKIDEPLAWMHADAQRLNAIAQAFNEIEFNNPAAANSFAFRRAQVDSRRLALTLTSGSDETLRATVDRMLIAEPSFDIAALAERTALYLDESDEIDSKWADEGDALRHSRENDYWQCYAAHELALPIGKRLVLRAADDWNVERLERLESDFETHHPRHPWTNVVEGQRQSLTRMGQTLTASLTSVDGGLIKLPAVDRPTVLLVIGPTQTPSLDCLNQIAAALQAGHANNASLVIAALAQDESTVKEALADYDFVAASGILKRGFQTALLQDYDIRRLPTALLADANGKLVNIVRSNNWDDEVATAVIEFMSVESR